jgi:hypothetical protein
MSFLRFIVRRLIHRIVFRHTWHSCIALIEASGMTFAHLACERCFHYDPHRMLGVYIADGTEVYRVVSCDVNQGVVLQ